ncbi:hypothetical protein ACRB68_61650 [Actinomadura sp. RB68]|uniref:Uncharacterized protein n=2 Tax=Actinomadura macrotermitis TaxID=2585200 RepID=A0A7K0C3N7_9ACTN|nr:hypothetical protein [Actinomadura macrotermitis]
MRMPRIVTAMSCPCGARVEAGSARCRKCRARARWRRRRAGSRFPDLWS